MNDHLAGAASAAPAVPAYLTRFIGREHETALLSERLLDSGVRWITLTGPGGVGKTRLAVEAARRALHDQPDTIQLVTFVSLFGIGDPARALEAIARRLDPETSDADPVTAITSVINGRPALLLLDNADELVPFGNTLSTLLQVPELRRLKLLVTSRTPFNRAGESLLPLNPLPLPSGLEIASDATAESPAVRLFIDRAEAARLDLTFSSHDIAMIADICRRLDGLPLAIELTASKLRQLSLTTVASRVQESRFSLDNAIAPHDLPGHTALSDSIASSFELLSDEEREFLVRLSVFSGGISLESARRMAAGFDPDRGYPFADGYGVIHAWSEHLSEDPVKWESPRLRARVGRLAPLDIDVEATLDALAERSLLQRTVGPNGATRYQFLETISEFAQSRLAERDHAESVHHLHAATMVYLVDIAAEGMWTKHRFVLGTEHLDAELANIRLALTWLLEQGPDAAEVSMRLADVATFYFRMRGMLPEGIAWVKRALALTDEPSYRYNITLASLGFNLWMVGELDEAEDVLLKARDLVSATTIRSHIAATHFYLALVYWRRGPEYVTQIIQNLETARENFASWDDHIGLGVTGLAMAEVARAAGDPQMALQLLLQARVDMDEWKYDWGAATTEWFIGEVYRHLDDEVRAAHHLAAGLKAYEETGDRLGMSGCIGGIAALLAARQEWGLAARFFGAASVLRERTQSILPPTHQIDHDRIAEIVFTMIGTEEYLRGRADDQEFAVSEALRIARALETGSPIVADLLAPTKGYSRARQQVLVQLAQGKEVKQISHALNRGVSTIYRHIDAMMEDLNCKSIDELRERAKLVARPAAAD